MSSPLPPGPPEVPSATAAAVRICGRCGAASVTRFCGECGAPLDDESPGLRGLLCEGAAEIAGFDARLVNTLRDLLLHPVRIVRAYMARDAAEYVPALRMFFGIAGVYIAILALTQPYDAGTQLSNALAGTPSMDRLAAVLQQHGLTVETLWMRYEGRLNALFPLIAAFSIPVYAFVLWALDRSRKLLEHAMFAVALSNVSSIVSILVVPLAFWSNRVQMTVSLGVSALYCLALYYRIYRRPSRAGTAVRAVLFTAIASTAGIALSLVLMIGVFLSVIYF